MEKGEQEKVVRSTGFAPAPLPSQGRMLLDTPRPVSCFPRRRRNWFLRRATIPHRQGKSLLCCPLTPRRNVLFFVDWKLAVPTGAAPAVSALTTRRVCCFSSGPEDLEKRLVFPPGFAPRPTPSHSAMLLLHHGNGKLVAATGTAPGSRPLQGRANLSQLYGLLS